MVVYPKLNKSGLGNLLWMWAKAACWATDHQAQLLSPRWIHWDWRRYLRRDEDKRNYCGIFKSDGYIDGWRKRWFLLTRHQVSPKDYREGMHECLVTFDEMGDFSPLIGRHEFVRKEFFRMVADDHFPDRSQYPAQYIALHIRLGDFVPHDPSALKNGATNMRLPLEWYRDALRACRAELGSEFPAVVFSDGSDQDLEMLFSECHVSRAKGPSAMADLIALSNASFLIASRSSFSLWAAYIGQMPVLYHPGARPWPERVVHPDDEDIWECEWSVGDSLPDAIHAINRLTPKMDKG